MAQEESPSNELGHDPDAAPDGGSRRRTGLLIAGGILGAVFAVYLVAILSTVGGVPNGTVVAGIDIGGMPEEDAVAALEAGLAEKAVAPMTVTARQSESTFDPATLGLEPDYEATVDAAAGPVLNPAQLFRHVTGQTVEVPPVVSYDEAKMQEGVTTFAATADKPAVEPQIVMAAPTPTLEPGQEGEGLDQDAAVAAVASAYLVAEEPVALPVTTLTPTVADEEAQRVLDEYAVPAVSGPVKVTSDASNEDFSVAAIVESLSFSPREATLHPQLNVALVRANLPGLTAAENPGTDASWDVSSGTPVIIPSKQGRGVPDEELTAAILAVLPKDAAAERTAAVQFAAMDPTLTTEEAEALNITEKLSEFTQKFDYAEYRKVNVGQAAEYMNGKVLLPDDVYSMNGTILERTEANGYVEGTYISNGRFSEGLGGGVSIATTATWTAAFFAGLEAVEVNPHSLYISRYQPGLEATVAWGQLDLQFRNDSGNGVLITTDAGDTFITVTMWGTKKYSNIEDVSSERYDNNPYPTVYDDSPECSSQGGVNGFTIDVWRVFYQGGKEVEREKFTTNYDPTTRVICTPPPSSSSTGASSSPKPSG